MIGALPYTVGIPTITVTGGTFATITAAVTDATGADQGTISATVLLTGAPEDNLLAVATALRSALRKVYTDQAGSLAALFSAMAAQGVKLGQMVQ
jgi:hypothetical protein